MAKQKDETQGQEPAAGQTPEALKAELEASRQQRDQMLDMMIELRAELDAVKAQRVEAVAAVQTPEDRDAAEWEALKAEFADVPNIEVLERRIVVGREADPGIRLKFDAGGANREPTVAEDPTGDRCYWKLRWFNFEINGRADRFMREGYVKVLIEELQDPESIPGMVNTDGYVRQGARGLEVLGKIPRKLFDFKKKRDRQRTSDMLNSTSKLRNHLANGVAGMAGKSGMNADQAGTTVDKSFTMSITPQERERVTM